MEAEAVEAGPPDGADRAVGELVEGSAGLHAAEGPAEDGEDLGGGHAEQGQAADDGSDGVLGEKAVAVEAAGVHVEDAGFGEALGEELDEFRVILDEGEVALADALIDEGLGEDAGSGAELDDGAGVAADFAGDEACERGTGGRDGGDAGGVRADGAQECEGVFELGFGPLDVWPVDEGSVHAVGSFPLGVGDLSAGCGETGNRSGRKCTAGEPMPQFVTDER